MRKSCKRVGPTVVACQWAAWWVVVISRRHGSSLLFKLTSILWPGRETKGRNLRMPAVRTSFTLLLATKLCSYGNERLFRCDIMDSIWFTLLFGFALHNKSFILSSWETAKLAGIPINKCVITQLSMALLHRQVSHYCSRHKHYGHGNPCFVFHPPRMSWMGNFLIEDVNFTKLLN